MNQPATVFGKVKRPRTIDVTLDDGTELKGVHLPEDMRDLSAGTKVGLRRIGDDWILTVSEC